METTFQRIFGQTLEREIYCVCGRVFTGPRRGIYMNGMTFVFDCKCRRYLQVEQFLIDHKDKVRKFLEAYR